MDQKNTEVEVEKSKIILETLRLLGVNIKSWGTMLDDLPVHLWANDENFKIVFANRSFKESHNNCTWQTCHKALMGEENICSCCRAKVAIENNTTGQCSICKRCNSGVDMHITHTPVTNNKGRKFVISSSFHIKDMAAVTAKSKILSTGAELTKDTILVICSGCQMAKDKDKKWVKIDKEIVDSFNVPLSHGICDKCLEEFYPEYIDVIKGAREEVN